MKLVQPGSNLNLRSSRGARTFELDIKTSPSLRLESLHVEGRPLNDDCRPYHHEVVFCNIRVMVGQVSQPKSLKVQMLTHKTCADDIKCI